MLGPLEVLKSLYGGQVVGWQRNENIVSKVQVFDFPDFFFGLDLNVHLTRQVRHNGFLR